MTQQEHLTTEQLSAYLDKQLTPQEQAFFDAHLQSCQRCSSASSELRRTVVLLHAMPQPELPRSFTLPASVKSTQIRASRPPQVEPSRRQRPAHYTLWRTVRAVSTLAAVIGLIFILSGILPNIHLGQNGATMTSASAPSHNASGQGAATPLQQPRAGTPSAAGTPVSHDQSTRQAQSPPSPTPVASPTPKFAVKEGTGSPPAQTSTLPSALDLGQPAGRLSLGALLLLLSIAGIITTRRRRSTVN